MAQGGVNGEKASEERRAASRQRGRREEEEEEEEEEREEEDEEEDELSETTYRTADDAHGDTIQQPLTDLPTSYSVSICLCLFTQLAFTLLLPTYACGASSLGLCLFHQRRRITSAVVERQSLHCPPWRRGTSRPVRLIAAASRSVPRPSSFSSPFFFLLLPIRRTDGYAVAPTPAQEPRRARKRSSSAARARR
ncbi:hypothetical protein CDD83_5038 [Cordyceps sp. RAO-2017]|nr:hypothetical protein CDD83_5038 [Cordyceps sp. RAO-2017]